MIERQWEWPCQSVWQDAPSEVQSARQVPGWRRRDAYLPDMNWAQGVVFVRTKSDMGAHSGMQRVFEPSKGRKWGLTSSSIVSETLEKAFGRESTSMDGKED